MSQDGDKLSSGFELEHFEKNRYFQGKLMTAQDMLTDQQYHADRLETVNKLTVGSGTVSGLSISEFESDGDKIRATIEPGLAIDTEGRPIVVRNPTTESFPAPQGDEVYLYLEHDSERKDPVPVPGKEPLSSEDSEESRILEVFELTAKETAPSEYKHASPVEFPDLENTDMTVEELADEIARQYHEERRTDVEGRTDTAVFVGSFKRTPDGEWRPGSETRRRPYVYDNDMLFEMLITHVTDTDNPHHTRIGEPTEYIESELDQIEGFSVRLEQMRSEMNDLEERLELHSDYTARRSLKATERYFDTVADTFEENGEISRTALSILQEAQGATERGAYSDEDEYVRVVETLREHMQTLTDQLDGEATKATYEQYVDAVGELSRVLDHDPSIIGIATSLDRVGETADRLEPRREVVS